MGKSSSVNKTFPDYSNDSYEWPDDLYTEIRDMGAVAFLVYTFGYIRAGLRDLGKEQCGESYDQCTQSKIDHEHDILKRSFDLTPLEVKNIIEDNLEALKKKFDEFEDLDGVFKSLDLLIGRASMAVAASSSSKEDDVSDPERPLTVRVYDDTHQEKELVFGICKDDTNKRITLVFRGTDNELAFRTNWLANLDFLKTSYKLPSFIKDKIKEDKVWFHKGFYNYVMKETLTTEDAARWTKYDQILESTKEICSEHPDYKIYITGHSLGGALSGMVAFFLSLEEDLPKPVTCLNFASPRIGDYNFLQACQILEREEKLRYLRVVNDNDTIAAAPSINYNHAGFQVMLYKNKSVPVINYPKLKDGLWAKTRRAWQNSWLKSLNVSYDHGEYRKRVKYCEEELKKYDLNNLYANGDVTGFF